MNEAFLTLGAALAMTPGSLEAYERFLPEIMVSPAEQTLPIHVDVSALVSAVLGALPLLRSLRPRILEELPKFNLVRFDKLEGYALALGHAHMELLASRAPAAAVTGLAEQVAMTREQFLSEALALAERGLIDGALLVNIKDTTSYRQQATDLLMVARVIRMHMKTIEGKTMLQLADLDAAVSLADRLMGAMAERDRLGEAPTRAEVILQKAFTLFFSAYRDARRAALYLEPDHTDDFAPMFFANDRDAQPSRSMLATGSTAAEAAPPSPLTMRSSDPYVS